MAEVAQERKSSLERRKKLQSIRVVAIKKGLLTHEVDEGSPCLRCGGSCPGFSLHFWRKVCKNCLCPREEHDIGEEREASGRISVGKILFSPDVDTMTRRTSEGRPYSPKVRMSCSSTGESPSILRKLQNYLWTPKGCSVEEAKAYFNSLPASKAPVRGTPGEKYHQKQLIRQLPAHDVDMMYCNELTDEEAKQMELFVKMRKEKCVGRGEVKKMEDDHVSWKCEKCQIAIKLGEVVVVSGRSGPWACWHPACFTCSDCSELLVDLIYFYHSGDGKVYCGRHHAEKVKPRCAACDELIVCREYTRAEDQDWHLDHFCCLRCDQGLGGQQYRPQDGQPYCLKCYEIAFASICETCGKQVTLDQARLNHEELVWHGTDECFVCAYCSTSLLGQPYLPREGKVFCSKEHAKKFKAKSKK